MDNSAGSFRDGQRFWTDRQHSEILSRFAMHVFQNRLNRERFDFVPYFLQASNPSQEEPVASQ